MNTLYHSVVKIDLPIEDPYACHQIMAKHFSLGPAARRDFQFIADEGQAYVRSASPRIVDAAWKPVPMPRKGDAVLLLTTMWFDASRMLNEQNRTQWRNPSTLKAWLQKRIETIGSASDISVNYLPSVQLNKPGIGNLMINPIRIATNVRIEDEQGAAHLLATGLGRGRAFGFGCVLFKESQHV